MIVHLNAAGQLFLAEQNDFKRLHCAFPRLKKAPDLRGQLGDFVELEGTEAAWISLDWMRRQAVEPRAAWLFELDRMIDWAKTRGWVSPDDQRVKAHVIWHDADPQLPR
ncbi:hypothetical protein [Ottowia thiooxydans]|uniref:Uncharacterized protein n=1 Tax=Ottowia thiooxydans TaxID=219182 RepID=A0ABV2Q334_9BURK